MVLEAYWNPKTRYKLIKFFQNLSSFSGHISKLYVYSGEFRTPAPNQRAVLYAINLKEQKFKKSGCH